MIKKSELANKNRLQLVKLYKDTFNDGKSLVEIKNIIDTAFIKRDHDHNCIWNEDKLFDIFNPSITTEMFDESLSFWIDNWKILGHKSKLDAISNCVGVWKSKELDV
jgi:hypothetical protein